MFIYGGFENLGIEYLSAVLKAHGFKTQLALDPRLFDDPFLKVKSLGKICSYQKTILRRIKEFDPGLIVFSVVSADYVWAINLATEIKNVSGAHITFGGIHPPSVPERVIKQNCVDSVVVGEGEFALLDLANSLRAGKADYSIKNIWFRAVGRFIENEVRPYIENLDSLPFPDKELYYNEISAYKKGYTVITRRGCINSCSYCHNSVIDSIYFSQPKRIRLRSTDNVIEELKQAKNKYRFKLLRVNDDIFTSEKRWLKEFCLRYEKEIDAPLYCFGSPATIDEEMVSYLKRAGCYQLCLGVQSVNPMVRRDIFRRPGSNEEIIRAIKLCRRHKIRVVVDNIIGYPGEKDEHLLEMAKFYSEHRPDRICVFWLVYYPRTSIVETAEEKEVLNKESIEKLEENPFDTANTLFNEAHDKQKKKYHLFMVLYHLMPAWLFNWMLENKFYKILPNINPAPVEYLYTIFAKDRLDIPRRRYYRRYLKYLPQVIFNIRLNGK